MIHRDLLMGSVYFGECISRLKSDEFLSNNVLKYPHGLNIFISLKKAIPKNSREKVVSQLLQEEKMLGEFELSKAKQLEHLNAFHYWNTFLKLVCGLSFEFLFRILQDLSIFGPFWAPWDVTKIRPRIMSLAVDIGSHPINLTMTFTIPL